MARGQQREEPAGGEQTGCTIGRSNGRKADGRKGDGLNSNGLEGMAAWEGRWAG